MKKWLAWLSHVYLSVTGFTFLLTKHWNQNNQGTVACAAVGLNYGSWSSPEIMTAALSFLEKKGESSPLYVGLKKKSMFKTDSWQDCEKRTSYTDIAAHMEWITSNESVPVFLFNSTTFYLDRCDQMNIFVQRTSNGRLHFQDSSDWERKKFLCVTEVGKFRTFLRRCLNIIHCFNFWLLLDRNFVSSESKHCVLTLDLHF